MKGNDGHAGVKGNDGHTGVNGNDGHTGVKGNDGHAGVNGNDGHTGVKGNDRLAGKATITSGLHRGRPKVFSLWAQSQGHHTIHRLEERHERARGPLSIR